MSYLEVYLKAWSHAPFAKALGWTLIHFLWEGVAIALLLAGLLLLTRGGSARYALACLALIAMLVSLGVTLVISIPGPSAPRPLARIDVSDAGPLATGPAALPPVRFGLKTALPWVPVFWMAGVLIFYVRTLGGWLMTRRLRRAGVSAASPDWQARLDLLCGRLRLSQPVVLLESCLVDVPVIMGFLRPVVLMPIGLVAGLSTDQLECILIHELAHIRRWDYVVNLLQNLVEGLLFYHPAVWWVSAQIRAERENCCDDVVVNVKGDARGYAAALATLEQNRWPAGQTVLAATGGSLMKRIRRLLREPERHRSSAAPVSLAGLLLVSVGVAVASWQTNASPEPKPARAIIAQTETPRVTVTLQVPKPPVKLLAQTAPPQPLAAAISDLQEAIRNYSAPETPYRKWLTEDVAYIISDEERAAFKRLQTDEEKEHFMEQFWLRRDPTPGTPENEMKDEHYRRIAYANDHFSDGIPGWKTDRGRIYITYGPPDEIESHPSGGSYRRPPEEGGGTITTVPFEQWRYRWIADMGENIIIEFVDPTRSGEFRMTYDPSEKNVAAARPAAKLGATVATVQVMGTPTAEGGKAVLISVPLPQNGSHTIDVIGTITSMTPRPVQNFRKSIPGPAPLFTHFVQLGPGSYTLKVLVRDQVTGVLGTDEVVFDVK